MKIKKLNEDIQHCWFGYYMDKDGNKKYFYMTKDSTSTDPDEASEIMEDSIPEPYTKFVFQGSVANTQAEKQGWKLIECKSKLTEAWEKGDPVTLWWKDPNWHPTSPCYASCTYVGKTKDGMHKFTSDNYGWTYLLDMANGTITTPNGKTFDVHNESGWMHEDAHNIKLSPDDRMVQIDIEDNSEVGDDSHPIQRGLGGHSLSKFGGSLKGSKKLFESTEENWAVFATDRETGKEYCSGVYSSESYAHRAAAMDRAGDIEYGYGDFSYRVERVDEYADELWRSYGELNKLKLANNSKLNEGMGSDSKAIAGALSRAYADGSGSQKARMASDIIDAVPDDAVDGLVDAFKRCAGNIKLKKEDKDRIAARAGVDNKFLDKCETVASVLDALISGDILTENPGLCKTIILAVIAIIAIIEPTPIGEAIGAIILMMPAEWIAKLLDILSYLNLPQAIYKLGRKIIRDRRAKKAELANDSEEDIDEAYRVDDLKAYYNTSTSIDREKYPNFFVWYDEQRRAGRINIKEDAAKGKGAKEDITQYRSELQKYIDTEMGRPHAFFVDETFDGRLCVDITWGDWKHEHLACDWLVKDFFANKNRLVDIQVGTTEENGGDAYSATHYYSLRPQSPISDEPLKLKLFTEDIGDCDEVLDFKRDVEAAEDIDDIQWCIYRLSDGVAEDNCQQAFNKNEDKSLDDVKNAVITAIDVYLEDNEWLGECMKSPKMNEAISLVDKKVRFSKGGSPVYFTDKELAAAKEKYPELEYDPTEVEFPLPKDQKAYILRQGINENYIGMEAGFNAREDDWSDSEDILNYDGESAKIVGCSVDNDNFRDSYWDIEFEDGSKFDAISGYNLTLYKQVNEASYGGQEYTYEVHWVSPDGNDKLLGASKTVEGATKIAINQMNQIFESPFENIKRKTHFISELYIVNATNGDDVTTEEVENHQNDLINKLRGGLNEASYGGAFGIEDDQYFTREDIESAAEEVMGHIAETFTEPYHLGGTWFENGEWIVNVQGEQFDEYEESIHIDMRKIRTPLHLKKVYAMDMAAKIIAQIKENNGMNEWVSSSASRMDWDDDDEQTYFHDDEQLKSDYYTYVSSKSVPDSDGFMTDYTWYQHEDGTHVFVFGDNDIYGPEDGYFDHTCDSDAEAREWFDSYNGFEGEDDDDVVFEFPESTESVPPHQQLDEAWDPYDQTHGWNADDIELHKSIDWRSRNYGEYPVPEDSFNGKAYVYGVGKSRIDADVKFIKYIRPNPIFPPYYAPEANPFKDGEFTSVVGPMYDGHMHGGYQIHDRYETQEVYNQLSEKVENWHDVYKKFLDIVETSYHGEPGDEERMNSMVDDLYNQHKGEYAWDLAYSRWHEDDDCYDAEGNSLY